MGRGKIPRFSHAAARPARCALQTSTDRCARPSHTRSMSGEVRRRSLCVTNSSLLLLSMSLIPSRSTRRLPRLLLLRRLGPCSRSTVRPGQIRDFVMPTGESVIEGGFARVVYSQQSNPVGWVALQAPQPALIPFYPDSITSYDLSLRQHDCGRCATQGAIRSMIQLAAPSPLPASELARR